MSKQVIKDALSLVKTVLEAELKRQRGLVERAARAVDQMDEDMKPLLEERAEWIQSGQAALVLVEGLGKALGNVTAPETDPFTGAVEEPAEVDSGNGYAYVAPAEEDPYDVAFAKTDTVEPSKTETFGRAPLMGEPGF